jgi:hypothetical protein
MYRLTVTTRGEGLLIAVAPVASKICAATT